MALVSLAQVGMRSQDLLTPSPVQSSSSNIAYLSSSDERKDYFKQEHGLKFAGTHLILDIWDADYTDDLALVEQALDECIVVAGATKLHMHLHHFTPNGGISGVAVLSESHISIHTWPERNYAALDVFMCGDAQPHKAIAVLQKAFGSKCRVVVTELKRGLTAE